MSKYNYGYNLPEQGPIRWAFDHVSSESRVLELGSANGLLTKHLSEIKGCQVDIIEIDAEAGEQAAQFAYKAFYGTQGDLEGNAWFESLSGERYDYILCIDVLEHLRDPERVLSFCKTLLSDDGTILMSIPNVGHNAVLIKLCNGLFRYQDLGIMDNTHLRFFTRDSIVSMIQKCGMVVTACDTNEESMEDCLVRSSYRMVPDSVAAYLKNRLDGLVAQYLVTVKRHGSGISVAANDRMTDRCIVFNPKEESLLRQYDVANFQLYQANTVTLKTPGKWEKLILQIGSSPVCIFDLAVFGICGNGERTRLSADESNGFWSNGNGIFSDIPVISFTVPEEDNFDEIMVDFAGIEPIQPDMLSCLRDAEERIEKLTVSQSVLSQSLRESEEHCAVICDEQEEQKAMIECLTEKNAVLESTAENTEAALSDMKRELEETEKLLFTSKARVTEINKSNDSLRSAVEDLTREKERLNHEVAFYSNLAETVMNSTTWKLTLPIRKMMDILLGRKKQTERPLITETKSLPEPAEVIEVSPVQENPVGSENVQEAEMYRPFAMPTSENPTVSIIIPVYNQFHFTYACLKAIAEQTGKTSYEVIIADDCSTDQTTEVMSIVSGIRVVRNETNLRFLMNCNHAALQARGRYILFLNNDTRVQQNWLDSLVELMESSETIGMVGSKFVYPDGTLQEAGGILWKDGSAWNYGHGQDPDMPEYNYVKEADYISGASIMIRKELWDQLGGFDERFAPAYCEDSDLAFQVRAAGYKVMYQPRSVVVHYEGVSNGTDTSSGQKAYQVVNSQKFYEKWKDILEAEHNPNAVNVFAARDRSIGRKTLLMVDHYVPQFDRDAGSRTVFQYLKLFAAQGYNVKFIGDNFYRYEPYTTVLQQMGIEVLYGPWYAQHWKEWIGENAENIGYVFLNRPHIAVNYIDWIREKTDARIIYYGHDLHFLRTQREAELTGNASRMAEVEEWKEKELSLMRKADMAYYPSEVEVQEIRKIDSSIRVKAIPAYLFEEIAEERFRSELRKDLMFVGGYNHTPNVDALMWFAKEIMPEIIKLDPDIKLHMIGSHAPEEIKALADEHLIYDGMVSDSELEEFYRNCRISVVPLRYGAGIKGKVVEAMYHGMPVITTSVGAEGILNAEDILCVEDEPKAFARMLVSLYNSSAELEERSAASYDYIRKYFSPDNAVKVIGCDFDMSEGEKK